MHCNNNIAHRCIHSWHVSCPHTNKPYFALLLLAATKSFIRLAGRIYENLSGFIGRINYVFCIHHILYVKAEARREPRKRGVGETEKRGAPGPLASIVIHFSTITCVNVTMHHIRALYAMRANPIITSVQLYFVNGHANMHFKVLISKTSLFMSTSNSILKRMVVDSCRLKGIGQLIWCTKSEANANTIPKHALIAHTRLYAFVYCDAIREVCMYPVVIEHFLRSNKVNFLFLLWKWLRQHQFNPTPKPSLYRLCW